MTTLLHELERTGGRYGLQTMCEGGGQANVTVLSALVLALFRAMSKKRKNHEAYCMTELREQI